MIFRPQSSDGTCDIIILKMEKFWIGRPKILGNHNLPPKITHFMINSTRPIAKMALVSHIYIFFAYLVHFSNFLKKIRKFLSKLYSALLVTCELGQFFSGNLNITIQLKKLS